MECPFVCIEPRESVLESIAQNNPGAKVYCLYGETYEIPIVKGVDSSWIDINTLTPTTRSLQYVKSKVFHEPKPYLEKFLLIDQLLSQYGIREAFYLSSTTHVYFSVEYLLQELRNAYHGLAAPYLGKSEMSLTFMYIRAPDIFCKFVDWLIEKRHVKQHEPKTACQFWFTHRTHETDFLPCVSNECDVRESDFDNATNLGTEFRGVWDNDTYGLYMGCGRENSTSAFPPSQFTYNWQTCGDGNSRPYIHRHGNCWPLYTLTT
jgi:hypothetical protein